mmetsp:Transcript_18614/g.51961  ORF Transcript_18614/g.51961 Transcript_18614/m.51961 type:complete len:190 (-) Transcript_18614:3483-4052(-)
MVYETITQLQTMSEAQSKGDEKVPGSQSETADGVDEGKHENGGKTIRDGSTGSYACFDRNPRMLATSRSLFVTGFAPAINRTHVEKLFSKFGRPERISDFLQKPGTTPGSRYCFVEYDSIENAQKAMDNLDGRMLLRKRLVVKPSHTDPGDRLNPAAKASTPMHPAKERALIDKKIAALKKKIQESRAD